MARRNLGLKLLDDRWDLPDQAVQMKGVYELHERSKLWLKKKEVLYKKKYYTKIRHADENIKNQKETLKQFEVGYDDKIDNILKQDKEVYLMCRNKSPEEIIEILKHMIFRQRKAVDKVKSEIKGAKEELFEVELNIATLKDKVNSGQEYVRNKDREEDIKYTAALEYAKTQSDVCDILLDSYKKIIGVLKKDSMYYDDVIEGLKNDSLIQSQSILMVLELGQLVAEDFAWLKEEGKKKVISYNRIVNEHRKEIKKNVEAIRVLEMMKAKLNEFAAKSYPMFQEENDESQKDLELEEMKEQWEEAKELFRDLKELFGTDSLGDIFRLLENLRANQFEYDKLYDELFEKRKKEQATYEQSKTLATYLDNYFPEEVKRFNKEGEAIREEIDMTVENIQTVKNQCDDIKQSILNDKHYFMNLDRLLWTVDVGTTGMTEKPSVKEGQIVECNRDDPFGLFAAAEEPKSPIEARSQEDDETVEGEESPCQSDSEDIPYKLMDRVMMKTKILHDSIGDRGFEDEIDPEIMVAYGDIIAEEQPLRQERLEDLLGSEKIVVRQYKPRYEDPNHFQTSEIKKRLELKYLSRQLVVQNEVAKEKGEIRFHMHPQGVFRGMYIEEDSEDESTVVPAAEKAEAKKEDEEGDMLGEESDIGYEETEEDNTDSDLDPNEPKPHICY